jgi:DNA invertase Pin-like site-specific DNA recombinase
MATTGKFVVYYRVSTQEQGRSGLGLEAPREAVLNYLNGGNWSIASEFTEIESGKRVSAKPMPFRSCGSKA